MSRAGIFARHLARARALEHLPRDPQGHQCFEPWADRKARRARERAAARASAQQDARS